MAKRKKRKQISIEEYVEMYCQENRMRSRYAIYVSPKTHNNLIFIAKLFKSEHYTTTSSLADAIISHHIAEHRDILNAEIKKLPSEFVNKSNTNNGEKDESGSDEEEDHDEK